MRTLLLALLPALALADTPWHVGVGIADCTGPAAEVVMMGYASNEHRTAGVHMRLHARAYVIVDPSTEERVAFVNADTWAATEAVIQGVESKLLTWFQGRYYSRRNIIVAGTHTHHGPAGASAYMLFQFSSFGYVDQSLQALVDGISEAVWLAHNNVKPAHIYTGSGMVDNSTVPGCPQNCASRNRSPTSFLHNPEEERTKYFGDDNVDRSMDLLKFVDAETGEPMGTINWFAVHPVSMTSDYDLISGDNKGYAEYIFEKEINGPSHLQPAGRGPFVASFAQGAAGDVSPNILGDFCTDTGLSCENQYSVCWQNGQPKNELCRSRGPGRDSFESMKIIGERQYSAAKAIFDQATQPLGDGLGYAARFVDLSKYYIEKNGTWVQTCSPCLGTTFAAGTTDGPSAVNEFGQNMTPSNGFLQFIAHMISLPTAEEKACQAPKNILLHPGGMNVPYPFFPSVLGFQLMRVGNLILVAVPGEFTTMAGKRTREAVKAVFVDAGVVNDTAMVVMNNVASGYAGYVTTIEEYQHQRYEGGFTAYGPHTHEAMTDILVKMAEDMVANKNTFPGMKPSLPSKDQLMEGQTDVLVDDPPIGGSFGDIKQDVAGGAHSAGETLRCILWGAHPRNNLKRGSSFFTVYRWQPINASDGNANAGKWLLYADDNDWDTRFGWKREGISASLVTLDWTIPAEVEPGWYVFHYSGDAKKWGGAITPISASCSIFEVSSGGSAKMAAKSAPEAAVLALAELKAAQTKPQEPEPAKPPSPRRLRGSEELHQ